MANPYAPPQGSPYSTGGSSPYDYSPDQISQYENNARQLFLASQQGYGLPPNPQLVAESLRTGLTGSLTSIYTQGQSGYASALTSSAAGSAPAGVDQGAISSSLGQTVTFGGAYAQNVQPQKYTGDDQSLAALGVDPVPNINYMSTLADPGKTAPDTVKKYQNYLATHGFLDNKSHNWADGQWDQTTAEAFRQYMAARYMADAVFKPGTSEGQLASQFLDALGYNVNDIITQAHGSQDFRKQLFYQWMGTQDPQKQRDALGQYIDKYGQDSLPDSIKQFRPGLFSNLLDGVRGVLDMPSGIPLLGDVWSHTGMHAVDAVENIFDLQVFHHPRDIFEDARQVRSQDLLGQLSDLDKQGLAGVAEQANNGSGFLGPLDTYETWWHKAMFGAVYNANQVLDGHHQWQNPFDMTTTLGQYAAIHNGDWMSFLNSDLMDSSGGSGLDAVFRNIMQAPVIGSTLNFGINLIDPLTFAGGPLLKMGGKGALLADRTAGRAVANSSIRVISAIHPQIAARLAVKTGPTWFGHALHPFVNGDHFVRDVMSRGVAELFRSAPILDKTKAQILTNLAQLNFWDRRDAQIKASEAEAAKYDEHIQEVMDGWDTVLRNFENYEQFGAAKILENAQSMLDQATIHTNVTELERLKGEVDRWTRVVKHKQEIDRQVERILREHQLAPGQEPTEAQLTWHMDSKPGTFDLDHWQALSKDEHLQLNQILIDNKLHPSMKAGSHLSPEEFDKQSKALENMAYAQIIMRRAVPDFAGHPFTWDRRGYIDQAAKDYASLVRHVSQMVRPEDIRKEAKQAAAPDEAEAKPFTDKEGKQADFAPEAGFLPDPSETTPTRPQTRLRRDPNSVYIGGVRRYGSTFWQNPFKVEFEEKLMKREGFKGTPEEMHAEAVKRSVEKYIAWILSKDEKVGRLGELRGKTLYAHEPMEAAALARLAEDDAHRVGGGGRPVSLYIEGDMSGFTGDQRMGMTAVMARLPRGSTVIVSDDAAGKLAEEIAGADLKALHLKVHKVPVNWDARRKTPPPITDINERTTQRVAAPMQGQLLEPKPAIKMRTPSGGQKIPIQKEEEQALRSRQIAVYPVIRKAMATVDRVDRQQKSVHLDDAHIYNILRKALNTPEGIAELSRTAGREFKFDPRVNQILDRLRHELVPGLKSLTRKATFDPEVFRDRDLEVQKLNPTHVARFGEKPKFKPSKITGAAERRFTKPPEFLDELVQLRKQQLEALRADWQHRADRMRAEAPRAYINEQKAAALDKLNADKPTPLARDIPEERPAEIWDDGPYQKVVHAAAFEGKLDTRMRKIQELAVILSRPEVGVDEVMTVLDLDGVEGKQIALAIDEAKGDIGKTMQIIYADAPHSLSGRKAALQREALKNLRLVSEARMSASRVHRFLVAMKHDMTNTAIDFHDGHEKTTWNAISNMLTAARMPAENIARLARGFWRADGQMGRADMVLHHVIPELIDHVNSDEKLKKLGGWKALMDFKWDDIPENERPGNVTTYAPTTDPTVSPEMRQEASKREASTGDPWKDNNVAHLKILMKRIISHSEAEMLHLVAKSLHAVPNPDEWDIHKAIEFLKGQTDVNGRTFAEKTESQLKEIQNQIDELQPKGGATPAPVWTTQLQWKGHLPISPYEMVAFQHPFMRKAEQIQKYLKMNYISTIWKGIVLTHPATSLRIVFGDEIARYVLWMMKDPESRMAAIKYIGDVAKGPAAKGFRGIQGLRGKEVKGWAAKKEMPAEVAFSVLNSFHMMSNGGVSIFHPTNKKYHRAMKTFVERTLRGDIAARMWASHYARDLDIRDHLSEAEILVKQGDTHEAMSHLDEAIQKMVERGDLGEAHAELEAIHKDWTQRVNNARNARPDTETTAFPGMGNVMKYLPDTAHGDQIREILMSTDSSKFDEVRQMLVEDGNTNGLNEFDMAVTKDATYGKFIGINLHPVMEKLMMANKANAIDAIVRALKHPFVKEGEVFTDLETGEQRVATKDDVKAAMDARERRRIHRLYLDPKGKDAAAARDHYAELRDFHTKAFLELSQRLEEMARDPKTQPIDYQKVDRDLTVKGSYKKQAYAQAAKHRNMARMLEPDARDTSLFNEKSFEQQAELMHNLLVEYTAHPMIMRGLVEGNFDEAGFNRALRGGRFNPHESRMPVIVQPIQGLEAQHYTGMRKTVAQVFNWYHEEITQAMVNYARGMGMMRMQEQYEKSLMLEFPNKDADWIQNRANWMAKSWMEQMTYQGQRSVLAHSLRNVFPFWGATANMTRYWQRLLTGRTGWIQPAVPFLNFMNGVESQQQQGGFNSVLANFMGILGMAQGDSLQVDPASAWFVTSDGFGGFMPGFGPIFSYGLDMASSVDPALVDQISSIPTVGPIYAQHIQSNGFNPILGWGGNLVTGVLERTTGHNIDIPLITANYKLEQKRIDDKAKELAAQALETAKETGQPVQMPTAEDATKAEGSANLVQSIFGFALPLSPKVIDPRKKEISTAQNEWDNAMTPADKDKVIAAHPDVAPLLQYYDSRTDPVSRDEIVVNNPWVAAYSTSEYIHPDVTFNPTLSEFNQHVQAGDIFLENPTDYLKKVQDNYQINLGYLEYAALKSQEDNFLQATGVASTSAVAKAWRNNVFYPQLGFIEQNNPAFAAKFSKNWGRDPISRAEETRPLRSLMAFEVIPQIDDQNPQKTAFWQQTMVYLQQAETAISDLNTNHGSAAQKQQVFENIKGTLEGLAAQNPEFANELNKFHFGRIEDLINSEATFVGAQ